MNCNICPRHCNIDRSHNIGYCRQTDTLSLARAQLHLWEEPLICQGKGSGAIFFAGCNLRCVYCQNFEVSRGKGKQITPLRLADIFKELEDNEACNINLVTPTHFARQIVDAFNIYKPNLPIVYNCGGYESKNTLDMLSGIVDIYLPDFKYSDNSLAMRLSNANDYFEVASQAIEIMRRQVGKDIFKQSILNENSCDSAVTANTSGNVLQDANMAFATDTNALTDGKYLMTRGMIIRHLVLPNHLDNTFGVIDYLAHNIDHNSIISLMGQYLPYGDALNFEDINRRLKP
ncbi:MAG: hypothetical protein RR348_06475, partial [Clostridia bacterium]